MRTNGIGLAVVALACSFGAAHRAHAHLILTPTGASLGFSLSTFYSDPNVQYGSLGVVNGSSGQVISSGYARGQLYTFNNVDGQSFGSQLNTANTAGNPTGIANANGNVYVGVLGGQYYAVSNSLVQTPLPGAAASLNALYGLWGLANGHLIAGTSQGLLDINPVTGSYTIVGPAGNLDGVSASPDGTVAYGEYNGNSIIGYSITSPNPGSPVFNSGAIAGGPDGTGVISGGLLNGDIVVNNNDGTLGLIDPSLLTSDPNFYRIIANGGTRGDLVSPDQSNGTLFLTQYEEVQRLSCGVGCAIGSTNIPEPMTIVLLGGAVVGLAATRRRQR